MIPSPTNLSPFLDRQGATHFTCEDCGREVHCSYEARTCVCLSCQFVRDHDLPKAVGFGWINSSLAAGTAVDRDDEPGL
jgi:ribosomal protein L37E